jgi:tetratricopeptide (TPR) repeat protein
MSRASTSVWRTQPALLTLIFCAISATPLRSQDETGGIPVLRRWVTAVERHVPGEADEPAVVVASWYRRDLASLFPYIRAYFDVLKQGPAAPRRSLSTDDMNVIRTMAVASGALRDPLRFAKRAAMLHADVAILGIDRSPAVIAVRNRAVVRRPPDASIPERSFASGVDGQYHGDGESEGHWDAGRTILDFVRPAAPDPEIQLWYRASAAAMMLQGNFVEAMPHLRHGVTLFPADAQLLFASGCLYEVLASPRIQSIVRRVQATGGQVAVESERDNLARAVRLFRQALEVDKDHTEARIRLGRVLSEQGNAREAAILLRPRPAKGDSPLLAYYRALFLGHVEDEVGDPSAAEAAYREASEWFPQAQSPRLSLALLAVRRGDREAVNTALTLLRARMSSASAKDDPWWVYGVCDGRDSDALVTQLRQTIGEAAR